MSHNNRRLIELSWPSNQTEQSGKGLGKKLAEEELLCL